MVMGSVFWDAKGIIKFITSIGKTLTGEYYSFLNDKLNEKIDQTWIAKVKKYLITSG